MKKAVFLDRDGTINVDTAYLYEPEKFVFIDGVVEFCRRMQAAGYSIIVVTNQSGVARGYYTREQMDACNRYMVEEFAKRGVTITDVFTCTELSEDCPDRKPNPGMFFKARDKYGIDMASSISVGDKQRDVIAGERAGVGRNFLLPADNPGRWYAEAGKVRFSVVIAAYGSEPFLPKLFECLDAQTFRDFEVLFAVEESPDRALELCRAYAAGHERVKVGALPKTGAPGASRDWAIDNASGEYLVTIDGDDWIEKDALENLERTIVTNGRPEVVHVPLIDGDKVIANPVPDALTDGFAYFRAIAAKGLHARNYPHMTVARVDFLKANSLYQLVGEASEDSEWTPRVWIKAKRIVRMDKPYYHYVRRAGSVSTERNPKILFSVARHVGRLFKYVKRERVPGDIAKIVRHDILALLKWYLTAPYYKGRFSALDKVKALFIAASGILESLVSIC